MSLSTLAFNCYRSCGVAFLVHSLLINHQYTNLQHFIHESFLATLTGRWVSSLAHGKRHLRCEETTNLITIRRHVIWFTKRRLNKLCTGKTTLSFSRKTTWLPKKAQHQTQKQTLQGYDCFREFTKRTGSRDQVYPNLDEGESRNPAAIESRTF